MEIDEIFGLILILTFLIFISFFEKKVKDYFKPVNRNYNEFGKNEINLTLIILSFLKLKQYPNEKNFDILSEIFDKYSEKLFVEKSTYRIQNLIIEYYEKEINIEKICKKTATLSTKHKLFLLYSLMDISAADGIYSEEEEAFIVQIRIKIRIPLQTFNAIKASYIKKGMKDERMIKAEQERKKNIKSYLPYNAYKILGVTSSVTKAELKKVYRTLAKKFHPDKFHGKSDELIQKAEEKFESITKAYKTILKLKQF